MSNCYVPSIKNPNFTLQNGVNVFYTENVKEDGTNVDSSEHQPTASEFGGGGCIVVGVGQTDEAPRGGRQFKATARHHKLPSAPLSTRHAQAQSLMHNNKRYDQCNIVVRLDLGYSLYLIKVGPTHKYIAYCLNWLKR